MGAFDNLGQALRWLRSREQRKQYEIAEAAGITKAMLSAYETGKQNPSLDTLEKLLAALGADLSDLHDALRSQQGGRLTGPGPAPGAGDWTEPAAALRRASAASAVDELADGGRALPAEWQRPLSQVLDGFETLIRQLHRQLGPAATARPSAADVPSGPRRLEPPAPLDDEE